MPGNGLRLALGSCYVLGVNIGWVASDAINQVVMESDFVPLFISLVSAWAETLWLATMGSWWSRSLKDILSHTPAMASLWFTSTFMNLMSLHFTSLASNEALTTLMAPCSLVLSLLLLPSQRHCIILKLVTVLLSLGGVMLIVFSDSTEGGDGPLGDVFAVVSACAYGAYDVYVKSHFDASTDLRPYLAAMGTAVLISGFPVLLLVSGVEPMVNLSATNSLLLISAAVLGYFLADFCMAKAVVHLSPLAATVGATINVPVSCCIDYFETGKTVSAQFAGGAVMCVAAFVLTAMVELESVQKRFADARLLCLRPRDPSLSKTLTTL